MAHRKVASDRLTIGEDVLVEVWGDHFFYPGNETVYSNRAVFVRAGNSSAYQYLAMTPDEAEQFAAMLLASATAVRNDPAQEELELSPTETWKEHRGDAA